MQYKVVDTRPLSICMVPIYMTAVAQLASNIATDNYLPEWWSSQSGPAFFTWQELQTLTAKTLFSNGAPSAQHIA